jgi:hypothetical protein
MSRYYYGTVPVLAWIINHYFYGGVHYSWLAGGFAPLDVNPKSSNPYLIYGDLYWAWMKRDGYDKYVRDTRRKHAEVILQKELEGTLDNITAARLARICLSQNNIDLYYPIVYRVEAEKIPDARRFVENSGLEGSDEVLVRDLREWEFDLLFADNTADMLFTELVVEELAGMVRRDAFQVLQMLEERIR